MKVPFKYLTSVGEYGLPRLQVINVALSSWVLHFCRIQNKQWQVTLGSLNYYNYPPIYDEKECIKYLMIFIKYKSEIFSLTRKGHHVFKYSDMIIFNPCHIFLHKFTQWNKEIWHLSIILNIEFQQQLHFQWFVLCQLWN